MEMERKKFARIEPEKGQGKKDRDASHNLRTKAKYGLLAKFQEQASLLYSGFVISRRMSECFAIPGRFIGVVSQVSHEVMVQKYAASTRLSLVTPNIVLLVDPQRLIEKKKKIIAHLFARLRPIEPNSTFTTRVNWLHGRIWMKVRASVNSAMCVQSGLSGTLTPSGSSLATLKRISLKNRFDDSLRLEDVETARSARTRISPAGNEAGGTAS